jgi:metallophosphoesterase superfamily enzyme
MTAPMPGPDGWQLAPEGAAVHPVERTAVIADVHLGYEWARGAGGDCLPAHSLAETLAKLDRLLRGGSIDRLIVAGDLVESRAPCRRTAADVRRLGRWLEARGVTLVPLAGNHDPPRTPSLPATCAVAGWVIGHGHRPIEGPRTISGHHHPVLRLGGLSAPCFLVGPATIVLPAFSLNAAGSAAPAWLDSSLRCVVVAGDELLDFGPVRAAGRRGEPRSHSDDSRLPITSLGRSGEFVIKE